MPGPLRLFAALAVTDPASLEWLAAAVAAVRGAGGGPGLKWVDPRHYHFTLKFLGETPAEAVAKASEAVEEAARTVAPFRLGFERLGVFPPRGLPRVLWAGCGPGAEELCRLAEAVERGMAARGFPPEARPFSPHLTLARVKEPRSAGALGRALAGARVPAPPAPFEAAEAALFRSELLPDGPRYTKVVGVRLW